MTGKRKVVSRTIIRLNPSRAKLKEIPAPFSQGSENDNSGDPLLVKDIRARIERINSSSEMISVLRRTFLSLRENITSAEPSTGIIMRSPVIINTGFYLNKFNRRTKMIQTTIAKR